MNSSMALLRRRQRGKIAELSCTRSLLAGELSRTRGCRTSKAPAPVTILRAAWWPLRTTRRRPSAFTPFVVLLEKLLHLCFDGLLQNLLSTAPHHDIEELASLKLLLKARDFQIDLFLWNTVAENRSLVHGVSFQPSLGQLMKRTLINQQDTPLFSPQLEHNIRE